MSDGYVTVAQCVEGLPIGRFAWELMICGFICWFLLGAINESTPLSFSFISTEWAPSGQSAAALAAALALGNFLAVLAGGWVADRHGRLAVIRPALLMTICCGMVMQAARTFFQAVAARFILGLASGGLLGVMPPLIAELMPSEHRGFYLTIWCSGWPAGGLFSIMVGCLLPSLNWRAFYTITLVPALALYLCTKAEMLVESPRYLYMAGRREEGYNTLLDMYDAENLPLPWAAESIAVTCGPTPSSSTDGLFGMAIGTSGNTASKNTGISRGAVTALLAIAMFFVSAAAQSMKLWMPAMLVAQRADEVTEAHAHQLTQRGFNTMGFSGAGLAENPRSFDSFEDASLRGLGIRRMRWPQQFHFADGPKALGLLSMAEAPYMLSEPDYSVVLVLAQAYIVEIIGVIVCAYLASWINRKRMVQWPLVMASFFSLASLGAAEAGSPLLCGPLIGLQLVAQIASLSFLQVFTSEHFPTSQRAKATAVVQFSAQLGNFVMPIVGGFVVQKVSAAGALLFFSGLYLVAWIATVRLPLPVGREQPLHDVDEPRCQRDGGQRARKRAALSTYQTF